jgi:hypothetical protein
MSIFRPSVRPLLALLTIAVGAGVTFAAGCTDDGSTCEGAACFGGFDAAWPEGSTVDVATTDANERRDVEVQEDAGPTDSSVSDSDADAGDGSTAADATDGGPFAIATPASPWRIATGGGFVYATTGGDVIKVPVAGGGSSTIQQAPAIEWITADATNLYFVSLSGIVYKRAHGGATNTPISNGAVALQVSGLVASATDVYWTEFTNGGTVHRVAINGSTMAGESVSPGLVLPEGLALSGASIYVAESNGTVANAGRIVRLNPDGGAPIPLATNRTGPSKPVVDGNRIYWYENGGMAGPIVSTPIPNGGVIAPHANTAINPELVTDGNVFYYGNASGGIVKIDVSASSKQTLYSSSQTGSVAGLAVSGNSLFWTDYKGSRLMTAPK